MTAGITRIHGGVPIGYDVDTTGFQSSFIGGYQLRWFKFSGNFSVNPNTPGSALETLIRKIQSVATVTVIGEPDSAHVMVGIDAGSFNGRGDYSGYGNEGSNATGTLNDVTGVSVDEYYIYGGTFDN